MNEQIAEKFLTTLVRLWADQYGQTVSKITITRKEDADEKKKKNA